LVLELPVTHPARVRPRMYFFIVEPVISSTNWSPSHT